MPNSTLSTEHATRPTKPDLISAFRRAVLAGSVLAVGLAAVGPVQAATPQASADIQHKRVRADGVDVFYREAGPADAPVLLLLHGFVNSSQAAGGVRVQSLGGSDCPGGCGTLGEVVGRRI